MGSRVPAPPRRSFLTAVLAVLSPFSKGRSTQGAAERDQSLRGWSGPE